MPAFEAEPRRRLALLAVALLSGVILLSGLVGGSARWGPLAGWIFTAAVAALPVVLIALGTSRRDARGLGPWLLALLVLLETGLLGAVVLSGLPGGGPPWAGLPLAMVVFVVGVGLGSVVLVGVGHGVTFRNRPKDEPAGRNDA